MCQLVDFLFTWQTLIGAAVGGLLGVIGALIVARTDARQKERAAGKLLIVDLQSVKAAAQNLRRIATESEVSETAYPMWVVERLNWRRPRLSPLFDAQMATLLHIDDNRLGAHLALFRMTYRLMEEHFACVREEFEKAGHRIGQPIPPPAPAGPHTKEVAKTLAAAGKHAEAAVDLIETLVLSRWPRWLIRLRMRLCPTETERRAWELLKVADSA